jgi:hypothetical protein
MLQHELLKFRGVCCQNNATVIWFLAGLNRDVPDGFGVFGQQRFQPVVLHGRHLQNWRELHDADVTTQPVRANAKPACATVPIIRLMFMFPFVSGVVMAAAIISAF